MQRIGNIIDKIASRENIDLAVKESSLRRSKDNELHQNMILFMKDKEKSILEIQEIILTGNWKIGRYRTFVSHQNGKERVIDWNPSFRDSVIQHAIHQVLGKLLVDKMIPDTYSGIKGRGASYGIKRMKKFLSEYSFNSSLYVLKIDVHHFYPTIKTNRLKAFLRTLIKDEIVLKLLDSLIDSHPDGLPIGNYLSQLLANLYFSNVDHWVKEELGLPHYMRYCDDIVILHPSKKVLQNALELLRLKLSMIGLELKSNAQVFPIKRNGIDFMGLVFHRNEITLRKSIERNFRRKARFFLETPTKKTYSSLASYKGWINECTHGRALWKAVVGKPLYLCYEEIAG